MAVLGGEDHPQDEGPLQEEEGGDAVLVHVAQLTEENHQALLLVATAQEERK